MVSIVLCVALLLLGHPVGFSSADLTRVEFSSGEQLRRFHASKSSRPSKKATRQERRMQIGLEMQTHKLKECKSKALEMRNTDLGRFSKRLDPAWLFYTLPKLIPSGQVSLPTRCVLAYSSETSQIFARILPAPSQMDGSQQSWATLSRSKASSSLLFGSSALSRPVEVHPRRRPDARVKSDQAVKSPSRSLIQWPHPLPFSLPGSKGGCATETRPVGFTTKSWASLAFSIQSSALRLSHERGSNGANLGGGRQTDWQQ